MAWKVNVPLEWITRALNLRAGDSPRELDDAPVNPVLDVLQGGLAVARWEFYSRSATIAGGGTLTLVPRDPNALTLAIVSIRKLGAVGTTDARFSMQGPNNAAGAVALWQLSAMTQRFAAWTELGGGQRWWVVPPDFNLVFSYGALAGGDTFDVRAAIATLPAGSNPN